MIPQRIVDAIGKTGIDHPAYLVRTGMFLGAKALFVEQLGWVVEREAGDIEKAGWRAVFVRPRTSSFDVSVQLTEEADRSDEPMTFPGTHLGVKVFDAKMAALAFKEHYERAGLTCNIEPANPDGTKWFVEIPELLTFSWFVGAIMKPRELSPIFLMSSRAGTQLFHDSSMELELPERSDQV